MKKISLALLVAGVVSLAGVSQARAQVNGPALFKAPFAFIVGDKVLPAGNYRITAQAEDSSVLMITNADGKGIAAFATTTGGDLAPAGMKDVNVAFKNFDGHYFLSQVTMPSSSARVIHVTKVSAERTLARLNLMPIERADTAK